MSATRPVAYVVEPAGYVTMTAGDRARSCLYVVDGGSEHGWSIRLGSITSPTVMNRHGEFRYDDRRHLRRWRFPREEALALAAQYVDGVRERILSEALDTGL